MQNVDEILDQDDNSLLDDGNLQTRYSRHLKMIL